jgi:hypothetical protein
VGCLRKLSYQIFLPTHSPLEGLQGLFPAERPDHDKRTNDPHASQHRRLDQEILASLPEPQASQQSHQMVVVLPAPFGPTMPKISPW